MAVITLKGTSFDYAMGMGVFDGLSMAFSDAKRTTSTLHDALSTLKSKIDVAATATSVDTSQTQAQQAQARESTKKSSLTLAYEKLDALISDTGRVDQRASSKISSREDDFYKRYYYLKPECKKTKKEKRDDKWAERWQNFKDFWGGVGNAIANIAKNVVDFCKEHWKEILKVLAVVALVVTSILLLIFVPGGGLLSAILLGAAKGCLIGLVTSVAINGVVNKCNGKGFWDGAIDAAFSGAVGGFIGGAVTGGLLGNSATMGKAASQGLLKTKAVTTFWGSVGRGAMVGASSSSISNAGVTTLSYWIENGTLKGSSGAILQSAVSGAISGGILGGAMGGIGYKIELMKCKSGETYRIESNSQSKLQSQVDIDSIPKDSFGIYKTDNGGSVAVLKGDGYIELSFDKQSAQLLQLSDKTPRLLQVTSTIDGQSTTSYKVVFEQNNLTLESAQRMSSSVSVPGAKGSAAALGTDGQAINIHHVTPESSFTIYDELNNSYHEQMHGLLHSGIGYGESFRNNSFLNKQFTNFESGYWQDRLYRLLEDFTGSDYGRSSKYQVLR